MTTAELDSNFRRLFESTPALLLALRPDAPRYTVVAVSDAYLRATATTREAILGKGLFDVFPPDRYLPGATDDLRRSFEAVIRARTTDMVAARNYQVPRGAEAGGGFEERRWQVVNAPAAGMDGELDFIVCHLEDVTERARFEQAAAEREKRALDASARLAALVEKAPDAIFVADVEGRCVEVSEAACRLLGYARAEIIGKTVLDLAAPEDVELLSRRRAELREKGGSFTTVEQRLRRKDGTLVHVEVSGTALPDGRRQHIVRDISERKRTEGERQWLAAVLRDSEDAITLQDLRGNILAWNRGAERLYGYSEAEALGMNVAVIVPSGEEGALDYLRAAARGEDYPPREVRCRTKDGHKIDVWSMATRIVEDGRTVAVATTSRDLTERNQRERERLLQLDALERLYQISSRFLAGCDLSELLDEILAAAITFAGADLGNIQLLDRSSSRLEIVSHRGFSLAWLNYWRHVDEGRGACGTALETEARVIIEDVANSPIFTGTEELEVQLKAGVRAVVSTPLVGRTGIVGMISVHYHTPQRPPERALRLLDLFARRAAELVERMRIEADLRRSHAKAYGVLMTSMEAIICIDRGRRITEWNKGAETIFGYGREEAIGAQLDMLIPERYLVEHRQHVAIFATEAEVGRRMDHDTTFGLRKNGEEFPISAKISKLVIDGDLVLTVSVRDISEERKIMDELRRAIGARDQMLGVVAHDLRNPLNSILLQAQVLEMFGSEKEPRSRKTAQAIVHAARRMNRIVADLLDVTRLEAGHLVVEREPLPAEQIVADVVELQRALVASRSLELRLDLAKKLPNVSADKHRLYQVFENLIGNAAKFTTSGSITIGAKQQASEVLFWVADTGSGIPPDQLPHLFDRFWQARKATRSGAGLGLAIVKGIVDAHGGRIWVESRAGAGTTFFFTFPIARGAEAVPAAFAAAPSGPVLDARRPTSTTVLLAEDDPDVRESLAEALWSDGYQVVAVANGAEALEQLRREPRPASVILDLMMPVVDGWGFLAARSRDPQLLAIPVIVISAQPDVEERVQAAQARHIQKPVPVDRLLAMMKAGSKAQPPPDQTGAA